MDNRTANPAVKAHSLEAALSYVRNGGRLAIPTYTRCTIINAKTLASWEKSGMWLLKEDGDGYRLHTGKHSVYLMPGQLRLA